MTELIEYTVERQSYIGGKLHSIGDTVRLPEGIEVGDNLKRKTPIKAKDTGEKSGEEDTKILVDKPEPSPNLEPVEPTIQKVKTKKAKAK